MPARTQASAVVPRSRTSSRRGSRRARRELAVRARRAGAAKAPAMQLMHAARPVAAPVSGYASTQTMTPPITQSMTPVGTQTKAPASRRRRCRRERRRRRRRRAIAPAVAVEAVAHAVRIRVREHADVDAADHAVNDAGEHADEGAAEPQTTMPARTQAPAEAPRNRTSSHRGSRRARGPYPGTRTRRR